MEPMTSTRPYLIRAFYDWILDNGLTPHLLVDAAAGGVVVPRQFVKDGKIVLNLSPTAVRQLELGNEVLRFGARFGGLAMEVRVPPEAVLGIYARENGQGMLFAPGAETAEALEATGEPEGEPEPPKPTKERPALKVVK
jgi:stringent starvation protein B